MTAAAAKVQAISAAGPVVSGSGLSIRTLPRVALHAAPWNARTSFDEDAMRGLCASIREHGILVPLIVRPLPLPHLHSSKEADADVDGYEIVAGHRRFLVASELKIEELPCDVRRLNDQEAREIALTDNLQRSDLSALEEAEGYQQMFQLAGDAGRKLTPADVAAKVGKPEAHVRLRLRLFSAESQVREALRAGSIQLGHALELARLEPAVQKQLLHWLLFEQYGAGAESKTKRRDVPSLAELRRHIQDEILLDLAKAPFSTKDPELVKAAGTCVDCPKRTGNSRLLFADVKQGSLCTDPPCYAQKLARHIDIAVEELTAKGTKAVRISEHWGRAKGLSADVLTSQQYMELSSRAINPTQPCPSLAVGIYVDGCSRGKQQKVCLDQKCKVHHPAYTRSAAGPADKARKAKAAVEKACRRRIFEQAVKRLETNVSVEEAGPRLLALRMMEANRNGLVALTDLLGWPKGVAAYDGSKKLAAELLKVSAGRAIAIGLLASVVDQLTVHEYALGNKPEDLHAVADQLGVKVAKVRAAVTAEFAAKKKKAPVKKQRGEDAVFGQKAARSRKKQKAAA